MTELLAPGDLAPAFSLQGTAGPVSSSDLLARGPAVLAFFKTTCPTCKMAFPVFGELERRFGSTVPVVGIAQDPLPAATKWTQELGFDGPVLDDSINGYGVSDLFGVRSVPTVLLIRQSGDVERVFEGWDRDETNDLVAHLAALTDGDASPVSTEADGRPPAKPG